MFGIERETKGGRREGESGREREFGRAAKEITDDRGGMEIIERDREREREKSVEDMTSHI